MALDPVTAALELGGKLIDKLVTTPEEKAKAQIALLELAQKGELTELQVQGDIVKTEAASSHWLAANWRPIVMLVFTALIVARWFGWAAPDLSQEEYLKLWNIVEIGLGGYVVLRSAEKIVPSVADAIKTRK